MDICRCDFYEGKEDDVDEQEDEVPEEVEEDLDI